MSVDHNLPAMARADKSNLNVRFNLAGGQPAPLGRVRVVGILNVTPDSFIDGGRWLTPGAVSAG
jgi:hypothetical protein